MSPKLALHQAIEDLSEPECRRLLILINTWHSTTAPALVQLAKNPTFRIPSQGKPIFSRVDPVVGSGINASEKLVEERC